MYSTYLWVKSFHLLFVVAWMSTVFYLPRILVNLAEAQGQPEVQARLVLPPAHPRPLLQVQEVVRDYPLPRAGLMAPPGRFRVRSCGGRPCRR